ncbi:uncharacterized protein LOC135817745 isoform X2 [Sycon ciliatum]|uniref:uncharacterized protein LOC135817745 isoform X2 n=1 Tax=Sycon ciliatum TaxID=27933 RepID=UPI0031F60A87
MDRVVSPAQNSSASCSSSDSPSAAGATAARKQPATVMDNPGKLAVPALAAMSPADQEVLAATVKDALGQYQQLQLQTLKEMVKLVVALHQLLDGSKQQKISSQVLTVFSDLIEWRTKGDAKLSSTVQTALYRLKLVNVDMQRAKQSPRTSTPSSDSDRSTGAALDEEGSSGAGMNASLPPTLQRSVDEAADLATNTIFQCVEDVVRSSRKVGDSLLPFSHSDVMSQLAGVFANYDKWLGVSHDFKQLRSGSAHLTRGELHALHIPPDIKNDAWRQSMGRFEVLVKEYKKHLNIVLGSALPVTVPAHFASLPKGIEDILKAHHCREFEARHLAAGAKLMASRCDSQDGEAADWVCYPIIIQGKLEPSWQPGTKLRMGLNLRRESIMELVQDMLPPTSPRCKSPEAGAGSPSLVARDSRAQLTEQILVASRPDLAYTNARIAALLVFGRANVVTALLCPVSPSVVTKEGIYLHVKVPFLLTLVEDRPVICGVSDSSFQKPEIATLIAEHVTTFTSGKIGGPKVNFVMRDSKEALPYLNQDRKTLKSKIETLAESVRRRTSSFSGKNSEHRRSKFYRDVDEEGRVLTNGDSALDTEAVDTAADVKAAAARDSTTTAAATAQQTPGEQPENDVASWLQSPPERHEGSSSRIVPLPAAMAAAARLSMHSNYPYGVLGGDNPQPDFRDEKYGQIALDCLMLRDAAANDHDRRVPLLPSQQQQAPLAAVLDILMDDEMPSATRLTSYSESGVDAQKEWEIATRDGTVNQPTVRRGDERRRARSDDKFSMENELRYGQAYPPSYYTGGEKDDATHRYNQVTAPSSLSSSASNHSIGADENDGADTARAAPAVAVAGADTSSSGVEPDRTAVTGTDAEVMFSATSNGSTGHGQGSGDSSSPGLLSSNHTAAAASGTGSATDFDQSSLQKWCSSGQTSSTDSSPSKVAGTAQSQSAEHHYRHQQQQQQYFPLTAGVDQSEIRPTSALPSDQNGPFDSSYQQQQQQDTTMVVTATGGDGSSSVVASHTTGLSTSASVFTPPADGSDNAGITIAAAVARVPSSASSTGSRTSSSRLSDMAGLTDKSGELHMYDFLPQGLFEKNNSHQLKRTSSSSSMHSSGSSASGEKAYADQMEKRNNPLARALTHQQDHHQQQQQQQQTRQQQHESQQQQLHNQQQQQQMDASQQQANAAKNSTWPMYKEKEGALWPKGLGVSAAAQLQELLRKRLFRFTAWKVAMHMHCTPLRPARMS